MYAKSLYACHYMKFFHLPPNDVYETEGRLSDRNKNVFQSARPV